MRITYYAILKEIVLVFGAVRSTPKKYGVLQTKKKANVRIKIVNVRIELKVCNVAKEICSVAHINAHKRGRIEPLDKPLPCLRIWST